MHCSIDSLTALPRSGCAIFRLCLRHRGPQGNGRLPRGDETGDTSPDPVFERPDTDPGPELRAVAADQARLLGQLLGHLPDTQREIVVLRVAVGLSADEVGHTLNMSSVAVRVAQSRALAKLRALAADVLGEPLERGLA